MADIHTERLKLERAIECAEHPDHLVSYVDLFTDPNYFRDKPTVYLGNANTSVLSKDATVFQATIFKLMRASTAGGYMLPPRHVTNPSIVWPLTLCPRHMYDT